MESSFLTVKGRCLSWSSKYYLNRNKIVDKSCWVIWYTMTHSNNESELLYLDSNFDWHNQQILSGIRRQLCQIKFQLKALRTGFSMSANAFSRQREALKGMSPIFRSRTRNLRRYGMGIADRWSHHWTMSLQGLTLTFSQYPQHQDSSQVEQDVVMRNWSRWNTFILRCGFRGLLMTVHLKPQVGCRVNWWSS